MIPKPVLSCIAVALLFGLVGCESETAPPPQALTREAVGHYCNMIVVDHAGPKAQIFEKGKPEPLWFSSVRDGLVYFSSPGEAQDAVAFYVHDMGATDNWSEPPNDGSWIDARKAFYVLDSVRRGGMGAKEAVPFGTEAQARDFIATHGGRVVLFDAIPGDYILGDDSDPDHQMMGDDHHQMMKPDNNMTMGDDHHKNQAF